ncbi:MAG: hypothetical protein JW780_06125 [Clostridiales bacterium]|nr:hypothetical protein [Clostridiales bacterium]
MTEKKVFAYYIERNAAMVTGKMDMWCRRSNSTPRRRAQRLAEKMNITRQGSMGSDHSPGLDAPSNKELFRVLLIFFGCSLITLFFSSVHSPFYRYCHFQDANVYMSVARAMQHGLMPYRDIFDHKGILLYILHYFAAMAFPKSMSGIYILLSLSSAFFLFYGYRISRLFLSSAGALIATFPLLLIMVALNRPYPLGAGAADEYLMPCVMGCLYYLLSFCRHAEKQTVNNSRVFSLGSMAVGFLCGYILWIKFTMVAVIGISFLFFYAFLITQKKYKDVMKSLAFVLLGLILISLPILVFLWKNHLFEDMWSAYVVFNYKYAAANAPTDHIATNIRHFYFALPQVACAILGLIYFSTKTKRGTGKGMLCVFGYLTLTFLSIAVPKRYYAYYFLLIIPFLIFATTAVVHFAQQIYAGRFRFRTAVKNVLLSGMVAILIMGAIVSSMFNWNDGSVLFPETDAERYATMINNYWGKNGTDDSPRLISLLGIDVGLMQLCDTYPRDRYYYYPAVWGKKGEEIRQEQIRYIEEGLPDFVFILLGGDGDVVSWFREKNPAYDVIYMKRGAEDTGEMSCYIFAKTGCEKK